MWAFWAAGVSLLLVQLNAGMEYLEAGLRQNLSGLLGDLPAVGMMTLDMAEHTAWHWDNVQLAVQAVPMVATGLLLVTASVLLNGRAKSAR